MVHSQLVEHTQLEVAVAAHCRDLLEDILPVGGTLAAEDKLAVGGKLAVVGRCLVAVEGKLLHGLEVGKLLPGLEVGKLLPGLEVGKLLPLAVGEEGSPAAVVGC